MQHQTLAADPNGYLSVSSKECSAYLQTRRGQSTFLDTLWLLLPLQGQRMMVLALFPIKITSAKSLERDNETVGHVL